MPTARIVVSGVSDEGDNVIVWGHPEQSAGESIGFVFQTKGHRARILLAERASRLSRGEEAVVGYVSVTDDWNIATGLSVT